MNKRLLIGGIILLGFALRFFALNAVSLRGDEAFTVLHWMREPLAHTLAEIATKDPQAPLSYALYRGWELVMGTSADVARLLPALLSVLGIPAMYALGHRLRGARLGLLAAFVWAINPYQIWHAQDARSYAIWAVLSLLAVWLALRALDKRRRIDWLLYVIAGALAGYVYYLELLILVALNLYVLISYWRNRPLLLRWLGAEIAIGLLLAPWYLQPRLLTGSGYGGTGSGFDPAQWVTRFLPTLTLFGDNARLFGDSFNVLVALLAIALITGLVVWRRRNGRQTLLLG
ncbi:MAG: glycosyltransferase family 39 protein, partial [Chloroflexota bacterium]